ncbi:hypothetical protein CaCOL14_002016 [Colletotrichum acutatum]
MGKTEQDGSCVNGDLRVHGLNGLRVADLSVTTILPRSSDRRLCYWATCRRENCARLRAG